jgi:hypothetical protein
MFQKRRRKMEQSARAKPADTRIDDIAINGITPATKTIQAFALTITQMSRQSLERTTQHIEKLRKVHSPEEVTSIQLDFVKESLEFATQHTRKVGEMLAALPLEMAKSYQEDWLQLVTAAVRTTEAAGHAVASKVEHLANHRN